RTGGPRQIDFAFEPTGHVAIRSLRWTRSSRRRHRTRSKLRDDLLPRLGIGAGMSDVQDIERQSGGKQLLVVAGYAVGVEDGSRISRRGRLRAEERGRDDSCASGEHQD